MALLQPTYTAARITQLRASALHRADVKGILLDVDNTLRFHHGKVPLAGVANWVKRMKQSGFRLMIVSNSKKQDVEFFAQMLGLPYQTNCKKPLPGGLKRACEYLQLNKSNVVLIGDQIFTDVLGGNLAGIRTILVQPAQLETGRAFRIKRWGERPFRKRAFRKTTML